MTSSSDTIDVFGPTLSFCNFDFSKPDEFCVLEGRVPPSVFVPLHAHPEREMFVVLEGSIDAFDGEKWVHVEAGESFDIAGGRPHAWYNKGAITVRMLIVTLNSLAEFFHEVGRPLSEANGPPTDTELQKFGSAAAARSYWLGSIRDNLEIGIKMPT